MSTSVQKVFVKDLKEKESIRSTFLVSEKMELSDKNGKPYMTLNLQDVTGSIDARVWENVENLGSFFQVGDFIEVKGHVQVYHNRKQMIVHDLKKASLEEVNLLDFVQGPSKNPEEMLEELIQVVGSLQSPFISELLLNTLEDESVQPFLMKSPAAKTIHHAYIGGLLEHILSICKIMDFLSQHYNFLDRDLLIFGAIFHDIGKIYELEVEKGIQYTDRGRLIGHMELACEMIDSGAEKILGFPEELKDILKHIVLSHHGRLEYGSPKRPKFLEALIVAMIDDLDSKVNTMYNFMLGELETGEKWSKFNQKFERYFYLEFLRKQLDSG